MNKKLWEFNRRTLKISIVVLVVLVVLISKPIKRHISVKADYKRSLENYEFIDFFSSSGSKDRELTIKVNEKYNELSDNEKLSDLEEIYNSISSVSIRNYDSEISVDSILDKKLIVKNNGKIEEYNYKNIDDLGEYKPITLAERECSIKQSNDSKISDTDIWVYTQYVVKNNLKSPKSADFPTIKDVQIIRNSDSIIVKSYVDAENSFGAETRSNFTVTLSADGQKAINVQID
ncbi:hypothetical protein [Clostridium sulfidigenes]|uniref:hypothetical protein n=1 Tax=Clostridium sulfidigenes TaxID=318464 RepID=UPI003F8C35FD